MDEVLCFDDITMSVMMVRGALLLLMLMDLNINVAMMVIIVMVLVTMLILVMMRGDLVHEPSMPEHVVDWGVWLCQNVSLGQVMLQRFHIMRLTKMVLAHVLFESSGTFLVNLTVSLRVGERLGQTSILLQDVEAHLEDVVHLELVAEALLLVVRIDVAEGLASRGMLNSHFCCLIINIIIIKRFEIS